MQQADKHVPPEKMKEWREAIKRGDNQALELLISELCKPVREKHDAKD